MNTETPAKIHVKVDSGVCVSSGNCALSAPAVFDQDDHTGMVVILEEHPSADELTNVRLAEELCPVRAIRILGD